MSVGASVCSFRESSQAGHRSQNFSRPPSPDSVVTGGVFGTNIRAATQARLLCIGHGPDATSLRIRLHPWSLEAKTKRARASLIYLVCLLWLQHILWGNLSIPISFPLEYFQISFNFSTVRHILGVTFTFCKYICWLSICPNIACLKEWRLKIPGRSFSGIFNLQSVARFSLKRADSTRIGPAARTTTHNDWWPGRLITLIDYGEVMTHSTVNTNRVCGHRWGLSGTSPPRYQSKPVYTCKPIVLITTPKW